MNVKVRDAFKRNLIRQVVFVHRGLSKNLYIPINHSQSKIFSEVSFFTLFFSS